MMNSNRRPPIFATPQIYTLRFNRVFLNFKEWQTTLLKLGMKTEEIDEGHFDFLWNAYGTLFVKWNVVPQAQWFIGGLYKALYAKYVKEKVIYDMKMDELLTSKTQFNQNEMVEGTVDEFATHNIYAQASLADRLPVAMAQAEMVEPTLNLVLSLVREIALPIQPNELYAYDTRGDYDGK